MCGTTPVTLRLVCILLAPSDKLIASNVEWGVSLLSGVLHDLGLDTQAFGLEIIQQLRSASDDMVWKLHARWR